MRSYSAVPKKVSGGKRTFQDQAAKFNDDPLKFCIGDNKNVFIRKARIFYEDKSLARFFSL